MLRVVPTPNPRILNATLNLANSKNFPKAHSVLLITKNRGRSPKVLEYLSMMAFNIEQLGYLTQSNFYAFRGLGPGMPYNFLFSELGTNRFF